MNLEVRYLKFHMASQSSDENVRKVAYQSYSVAYSHVVRWKYK